MLSQRRNWTATESTIRENVMMVRRLHASKGASILWATDYQVFIKKILLHGIAVRTNETIRNQCSILDLEGALIIGGT